MIADSLPLPLIQDICLNSGEMSLDVPLTEGDFSLTELSSGLPENRAITTSNEGAYLRHVREAVDYRMQRSSPIATDVDTHLARVLSSRGPLWGTLIKPSDSWQAWPTATYNSRGIARALVRCPSALEVILMLADVESTELDELRAQMQDENLVWTIAELYKLDLLEVRGKKVLITEEGTRTVEKLRKLCGEDAR